LNKYRSLPHKREFTAVEAARFLKVSLAFVVSEIRDARLPRRGTHGRIAFDDLLAYSCKVRERRAAALERMAENAHELGLDY